jgi:hypothetical protein
LNCLDCGQPILPEHKFCPSCGQKTNTERLHLKSIAVDVFQVVTDAEKGILPLIWQLFRRPGVVARAYVEGHRKSLFPPFSFLFLVVGILTFLTLKTEIINHEARVEVEGNAELIRLFHGIGVFLIQNVNLLFILMVPCFAFFNWLFFRKSGFNFAEFLVVSCYAVANYYVFSIFIVIPLETLFRGNEFIESADQILSVLYLSWATRQFLRKSGFKNFLVSLIPPILGNLFPGLIIWALMALGYLAGLIEISKAGEISFPGF